MVCWDENHRNGQEDQVPLLILRDRNHPSVVIWSICNEVLVRFFHAHAPRPHEAALFTRLRAHSCPYRNSATLRATRPPQQAKCPR